MAPTSGYTGSAVFERESLYLAKLPDGSYAKLWAISSSEVLVFYGTPTTSLLLADGRSGAVELSWDPLPDADQGYNVYRYAVYGEDHSRWEQIPLNDFAVTETTLTDRSVTRLRPYLWVVQAVRTDGSEGSSTTVAAGAAFVTDRTTVLSLDPASATLDGNAVPMTVPPVIRNHRVSVPASLLAHAGVAIRFKNDRESTVVRHFRENATTNEVYMTLDSTSFRVLTWMSEAPEEYEADAAPYMDGNEVMLPLRDIGRFLWITPTFDSRTRTVLLTWQEW